MTEQEAIMRHLSEPHSEGGHLFSSSFSAALRDARRVTGRDERTGNLCPENHAGSWLGALGYLVLLDHIGDCLKPTEDPERQGSNVRKALRYFSTLDRLEIDAVYALRCAFAHNYGLYNIEKQNKRNNQKQAKKTKTHWFEVREGTDTLITLPQDPWDGDLDNRNQSNLTIIDLRQLGDLVESVVRRIRELAEQGQLAITLDGGADELAARYWMGAGPLGEG